MQQYPTHMQTAAPVTPRIVLEVSRQFHRMVKARAARKGKKLNEFVKEDVEPVVRAHFAPRKKVATR